MAMVVFIINKPTHTAVTKGVESVNILTLEIIKVTIQKEMK